MSRFIISWNSVFIFGTPKEYGKIVPHTPGTAFTDTTQMGLAGEPKVKVNVKDETLEVEKGNEMLKIFSCLAFLLFILQADSSTFYIEKIGANTKYDSRYIFNHALEIIPQDKPVTEREIKSHIDCLVSELNASGIFEDAKVELRQTEKANYRELVVNTVYRREIDSFVISEVVLNGFHEIDKAQFQTSLNKAGIKSKDRLLKYYYYDLEKKIGKALVDVYPKGLYSDDKTYWLSIRPDGERKVKLIVAPSYSGCR